MSKGTNDSSELNGVVIAAGLVGFQSGAVVSRTLIKQPTGTVTVFAFDAGEGLSEHTAPFDALILNLEGEAEFSIAGVAHRMAGGDMLRIPAGQPHVVKALTPFKMLLIMIKA